MNHRSLKAQKKIEDLFAVENKITRIHAYLDLHKSQLKNARGFLRMILLSHRLFVSFV